MVQIVAVAQNAYHELPSKLQEAKPAWESNERADRGPPSPTAVQRLAALSASTANLGGLSSATGGRKQMHRRKKVCHHPHCLNCSYPSDGLQPPIVFDGILLCPLPSLALP